MKSKKRASPRPKINFAVDRDEIEVNSDWVEAVMAPPTPSTTKSEPETVLDRANPHPEIAPEPPAAGFFSPSRNSATGEESAPGAECSSVEISAAVAQDAPVAVNAPVAETATVPKSLDDDALPGVAESATVEGKVGRIWRPKPIRRITDGLTPGQYAVYRLMYEAGQGTSEAGRIYTGGYADLRRLTGMSKRGIQNVVAELQTKLVIRVSQKPGYHRTETTSYEVPDAERVLEVWFSQGWRYALGKSKALTGP